MQAFFKIVLPEATTGIAATAVFCFITAWNEYAFALIMTNRRAQTAPPFIPAQIGSGLTDWTVIARAPSCSCCRSPIFTFALRSHLLRGVTFGAIRKVRRMRKLLGPRRLEATSQWVMVLGIIALVQPWSVCCTATA